MAPVAAAGTELGRLAVCGTANCTALSLPSALVPYYSHGKKGYAHKYVDYHENLNEVTE